MSTGYEGVNQPAAEEAVPVDPDLDRFIDALWLEDGLSNNTLAAYRRDLTLFARWLHGQHASLRSVQEHQLMAYMAERADGKATSANRRLTVFKRFYRWALREHLITRDPTLRLLAAKQPMRVPKTLSEAQVDALLRAPDVGTALGLRDRAMLELMYASGLRVSELVGLRNFEVSLSEHVVRPTGKGNKERLVYLNDACLEALDHYKKARAALPNLPADERALFVSKRTGKRLTARRVEQIVARCLQSAGLSGRGFSPHKLRHTAATLMYQGGVDMLALKEILGHESVSTTQIYTHINQERLRAAVKASPLADQGYIAESKPSQQDSGEED